MSASKDSKFFTSAKTAQPIPIPAPLIEEALIRFTLDAAVRRIEFVGEVSARGEPVRLDAVVLVGDAGKKLLRFPDVDSPLDIDQAGLALLAIEELGLTVRTVDAAEIRAEPRASNARMIWACRARRVHVDDRVRLLDLLEDDGPMALSRAATAMQFARGAISAVLAMACADLIELDFDDAPLGPETVVRRRRPATPEKE